MKRWDYEVGGTGTIRTFTPRSDRAKERTPETLTFEDAAKALEFMKAAQAEGYMFAEANRVDPEQKLVKNGYFVIGDGGRLVPAGQDWGPRDTVYEVGDAMLGGPRRGNVALIEQILTGEFAKKMGFDMVFVLRERDVSQAN